MDDTLFPLDARLTPDYRRWVDDLELAPPHIWAYLSHHSTPGLAALFGKLFRPDFVEVEGCILLAENYRPGEYAAWAQQFDHDRGRIERMINHTHVYDLFATRAGDYTHPDVWEYLGRTLLACWRCALAAAYPGRTFEFFYATEPDDYGPTLSFCQVAR